jgi:hypothetical protein
MMTKPLVDDLLEGLIVALENEIIPFITSPKAQSTGLMMQSIIQEIRQVLPVFDTYIAIEHNQMTQVLKDMSAALDGVNGAEADRIRDRAKTLGARADVVVPVDQEPIRASHRELGYALQDNMTDLDVLQRAGETKADVALQILRAHLMPRIVRDVEILTVGAGVAGRG